VGERERERREKNEERKGHYRRNGVRLNYIRERERERGRERECCVRFSYFD
jgi:hypothetical protein